MTIMTTPDTDNTIRPGAWMRCVPFNRNGRVRNVFLNDTGRPVAVTIEADGGAWFAAPAEDIVPIDRTRLN